MTHFRLARRRRMCHVPPRIRNESRPHRRGSANRAGSGHGGFGRGPGCVRRLRSRTTTLPKTTTALMPGRFLFSLVRKPPADVYASCPPPPPSSRSSGSASTRRTRIIIFGTTTVRGSSTTRCTPPSSPKSACAVRSAHPGSTWPGNDAMRSSHIVGHRPKPLRCGPWRERIEAGWLTGMSPSDVQPRPKWDGSPDP